MIVTNGRLFLPEKGFVNGGFVTEGGRFREVFEGSRTDADLDLHGAFVLPGLIDLHIHGCAGADFSDADPNGLAAMGAYLASQGVTGFVPTSMSLPEEPLSKAFALEAAYAADTPPRCARSLGIHMEGPFFSPKRAGAQNPACLRDPDVSLFDRLQTACGGRIRIADLAPELPGAADFTAAVSKSCVVSAAHTDVSYEASVSFFRAGASHLTHLYNAMPAFAHRAPGLIGAASEQEDVTAELICDGIHVHPSAVRGAFRLFPGRICLISDAMRACGMDDGTYDLGGLTVTLRGREARLDDGTLAGAATSLFDGLINALNFGISPQEAVTAATLRPAEVLGCDDLAGSIAPGRYADFVICDAQMTRKEVWMDGARIYPV